MLKREIKFIYLFIYLFIYSCTNNNGENSTKSNAVIKCNEYTSQNFKNYVSVYKIVNDSVNQYADSYLKYFSKVFNEIWQIDSLICINSTNDKLVATINNSNGVGKYGTSDDISKLLGKKINGQWYFFKGGGNLVVPREYYGKDSMHPLSFHELSQIARKEMFRGAFIKNNKGELIVSDEWVDAHFYNAGFYAYPHPKSPGMVSAGEEFRMPEHKNFVDSVHWFKILDKWKHKIDTNEYKPLRRKKENTPSL